jgi:hypothetical protein
MPRRCSSDLVRREREAIGREQQNHHGSEDPVLLESERQCEQRSGKGDPTQVPVIRCRALQRNETHGSEQLEAVARVGRRVIEMRLQVQVDRERQDAPGIDPSPQEPEQKCAFCDRQQGRIDVIGQWHRPQQKNQGRVQHRAQSRVSTPVVDARHVAERRHVGVHQQSGIVTDNPHEVVPERQYAPHDDQVE